MSELYKENKEIFDIDPEWTDIKLKVQEILPGQFKREYSSSEKIFFKCDIRKYIPGELIMRPEEKQEEEKEMKRAHAEIKKMWRDNCEIIFVPKGGIYDKEICEGGTYLIAVKREADSDVEELKFRYKKKSKNPVFVDFKKKFNI